MQVKMRCFISLEFPEEIRKEIKKIQELIRKRILFTGKYTEPENLHLTLKFLGEVDEEKAERVKERLKNINLKILDAELGDAGVFSKNIVRIIWIKLNGKFIFELQKQIDERLSDLFEPEQRFMSHITIARVKEIKDKKQLIDYLKEIKPKKIKFKISKFFLKKSELFSQGPVYEDIEDYILD